MEKIYWGSISISESVKVKDQSLQITNYGQKCSVRAITILMHQVAIFFYEKI